MVELLLSGHSRQLQTAPGRAERITPGQLESTERLLDRPPLNHTPPQVTLIHEHLGNENEY